MQHYGCSVPPIEWLVMRTGQAPASAPCHSRQPAATPAQRSCSPRFDPPVRPSVRPSFGLQLGYNESSIGPLKSIIVGDFGGHSWLRRRSRRMRLRSIATHHRTVCQHLTPAGRGTDAAHQRALIPRNQQQCVLSKHFIIFITNRGQHLSPMRRTD